MSESEGEEEVNPYDPGRITREEDPHTDRTDLTDRTGGDDDPPMTSRRRGGEEG